MNLLLLLPVVALVVGLMVVFAWSLRSPVRKGSLDKFRVADFEESGQRHATHCMQIRQALDARDLAYLAGTAGTGLARRVRRERRHVVKDYLLALRGDFDHFIRLGRVIALLSPEIVAVHEFERFRLTVQFHLRCRVIALRLLLGLATLPQIGAVSDQVSHLAVRLEAALKEMGERAALAVEMASTLDRRNMNTV
jgi:hypothetical protein